jgi:crossover junction endodeoxyribonuclease RuvC
LTVRVLGVDPGTRACGYGLLDIDQAGRMIAVACGVWKLGASGPLVDRMGRLGRELDRLLNHYQPTHVCLENAFLAKNARSALLLGHARGVVMCRIWEHGLLFGEMSPTQAKKAVTGNGQAEKAEVASTLVNLLQIPELQKMPADASDAMGLAYALAARLRLQHLAGSRFAVSIASTPSS